MATAWSQDLSGVVALVTGARGGLGRAISTALRQAGARVVASGRGPAPEDLDADAWVQLDVTSSDDWQRVASTLRASFGRLDCLINNAGVPFVERIADCSLDQWRRVFSVNVESVLLGLQALLPLLRDSGRDRNGGSSVISISSIASLRASALAAAYCSSKSALTALSKSAAREFAALGYPIRVNTVHPGIVDTPMTDAVLARYVNGGFAETPISVEQQRAVFNSIVPIGRIAQPAEIAGAVVFLASSAATYVTGSELVVDGGYTS
jgi:NAD(P)-dependent dehydrogenase (short-subunit alcohol dehydrogenase family)